MFSVLVETGEREHRLEEIRSANVKGSLRASLAGLTWSIGLGWESLFLNVLNSSFRLFVRLFVRLSLFCLDELCHSESLLGINIEQGSCLCFETESMALHLAQILCPKTRL